MISIQIIDSGIGNMGSVANMLKKLGYSNEIKKTPDKSDDFDVTLLPGVGSFDISSFACSLVMSLERILDE